MFFFYIIIYTKLLCFRFILGHFVLILSIPLYIQLLFLYTGSLFHRNLFRHRFSAFVSITLIASLQLYFNHRVIFFYSSLCIIKVVVDMANTTFKKISIISWQSVLLVEENQQPDASHTKKNHIKLHPVHFAMSGIQMHNLS
jgi:hypothetical protein